MIYIIFILLATTLTGSFGALFLKQGMNKIETLSLKAVVSSAWVWLGVGLYIVSAVTNIMLLKVVDYSIGFPMTSLTYVWTVVISYFIFQEKITMQKVIAMVCIIAGVVIIS